MVGRADGRCRPARGDSGFVESLIAIANEHKRIEVLPGQAKLWRWTNCGKYVQSKEKSVMQPCVKYCAPCGMAALARVAKGKRPDSHSKDKVTNCMGFIAGRPIKYTALAPAKQGGGGGRRAGSRRQ